MVIEEIIVRLGQEMNELTIFNKTLIINLISKNFVESFMYEDKNVKLVVQKMELILFFYHRYKHPLNIKKNPSKDYQFSVNLKIYESNFISRFEFYKIKVNENRRDLRLLSANQNDFLLKDISKNLTIVKTNYSIYLFALILFFLKINKIIEISSRIRFFLTDEPLKIKQNKLITKYIGNIIFQSIKPYDYYFSNLPEIVRVFMLYIHITSFLAPITIHAYKKILQVISQLFDIFLSQNYNYMKKRMDKIDFKYDRAIVATLIMSIMLLIVYNIFGFYILFVLVHLSQKLIEFFGSFSDFMVVKHNNAHKRVLFEEKPSNSNIFIAKIKKITVIDRINIALKYAWIRSEVSHPEFLKKLLIGKIYE